MVVARNISSEQTDVNSQSSSCRWRESPEKRRMLPAPSPFAASCGGGFVWWRLQSIPKVMRGIMTRGPALHGCAWGVESAVCDGRAVFCRAVLGFPCSFTSRFGACQQIPGALFLAPSPAAACNCSLCRRASCTSIQCTPKDTYLHSSTYQERRTYVHAYACVDKCEDTIPRVHLPGIHMLSAPAPLTNIVYISRLFKMPSKKSCCWRRDKPNKRGPHMRRRSR